MVKDGDTEAVKNPLGRREKLIPQSEIERLRPFEASMPPGPEHPRFLLPPVGDVRG
jgi:hypothetical protein